MDATLNISWQQKHYFPLQGSPCNLYCHQRAQATVCWSLSQSNDRAHSKCSHTKESVGGQHKTFVDRLASDTDLGVGDMKTAIYNRKGWKEYVQAENRQGLTR